MNGLVPERRTNRNGVTQTKWVREEARPAAATAVPGPALAFAAAPEDDAQLSAAAGRSFAAMTWDNDHPDFSEHCDTILDRASGRCALMVAGACEDESSPTPQFLIAETVAAILTDERVPKGVRETAVANYLSIIPSYEETVENDEGINAAHYAAVLFAALDPGEASAPFDDTQREVYRHAARGLNGVALTSAPFEEIGLARNEDGYMVLPSLATVEVLREHPEKAAAIIDALIQRETFLPETARAIAESGALGHGAL